MATKKTPAKKAPVQKAPARKTAKRVPTAAASRLPGEQHPGQTMGEGRLHDRAGSQMERERHMHPGSTNPKAGSARSNKRAVKRGK